MCTFEDRREEVLIAYLYDDIEPAARAAFASHLAVCPACAAELDALSGVRADLGAWAPPEPAVGVGGETPQGALRLTSLAPPVSMPAPARVPAWMQAAAAVVFVAAALGAANLEVSYTQEGLSVRTGWLHGREAAAPSGTPAAAAPGTADEAPWRADLTALEQQLRSEMSAGVAPASDTAAEEAMVRRVRTLLAESEKRQQRELALRVAEVAREAQAQRQADLVRIDRSLGLIQSRTGVEAMRTQQQLNSLAQRVSQRP